MNFNIVTILLGLLIASSACGVKGPPAIPHSDGFKSYIEKHQTSPSKEDCKESKKKKCP